MNKGYSQVITDFAKTGYVAKLENERFLLNRKQNKTNLENARLEYLNMFFDPDQKDFQKNEIDSAVLSGAINIL